MDPGIKGLELIEAQRVQNQKVDINLSNTPGRNYTLIQSQ